MGRESVSAFLVLVGQTSSSAFMGLTSWACLALEAWTSSLVDLASWSWCDSVAFSSFFFLRLRRSALWNKACNLLFLGFQVLLGGFEVGGESCFSDADESFFGVDELCFGRDDFWDLRTAELRDFGMIDFWVLRAVELCDFGSWGFRRSDLGTVELVGERRSAVLWDLGKLVFSGDKILSVLWDLGIVEVSGFASAAEYRAPGIWNGAALLLEHALSNCSSRGPILLSIEIFLVTCVVLSLEDAPSDEVALSLEEWSDVCTFS